MSKILLQNQFDSARTFLALGDTPDSYAAQANKLVGVNAGATALEFKTAGPTTLLGLTDTPAAYTGKAGQSLKVNDGETAVEFGMQRPGMYKFGPGQDYPGGPSLQITAAGTVWIDVFRMPLPTALLFGDRILVTSSCELRNDATYNVEVVTSLILSNASSISSGSDIDGTGVYIIPATGHNIMDSGGDHYYNNPSVGVYELVGNYTTPHIYLRARARSTSATGAEFVTGMAGYGHLAVTVFPKNGTWP